MRLPRSTVTRVIVAIVLVGGFVVMASVFVPGRLEARDSGSFALSPELRKSLPSLGEVISGHYRVTIHAGPSGPLYSVYDDDGQPLALFVSAKHVSRRFPDLPLPEAHAETLMRLMDTPTGDGDW